MNQHHQRVGIFATLLILLLFGVALPSHAAITENNWLTAFPGIGSIAWLWSNWSNVSTGLPYALITTPVLILQSLFGWALSFLSAILDWTFRIGAFTTVPVVQTGWAIARDMANMLFILVLLAIAFATILRYESYGIKRLLPQLIIVALLVNFSLLFAGIVIDIGNDFGEFFTTGGNNDVDVGANISAAFGMSGFLDTTRTVAENLDEGESIKGFNLLIAAIANLILTIIVAFLFAVMAFLMVVRIAALWVLLIFLPLALVASIIPAGTGLWRRWVGSFVRWAFFPAVFGFFIYFAVLVGTTFQSDTVNVLSPGFDPQVPDVPFSFTVQQILQYVVVAIILYAGLIYANRAGLVGGKFVLQGADRAKSFVLKQTKSGIKAGGLAATRPAQRAAKRGARATMYGRDEQGQRTQLRGGLRPFTRFPGTRGVVSKAAEKAATITPTEIEEIKKGLSKNVPALQAQLVRAKGAERIAVAQQLAELGQLKAVEGLITDAQLTQAMKEANTAGQAKTLILARPDLALSSGIRNEMQLQKMFERIKPNDIEKMADDVLERLKKASPTTYSNLVGSFVSNMQAAHVNKMLERGQASNLNEIQEYLRGLGGDWDERQKNLTTMNPRLTKWASKSPGADIFDLGQPPPPSPGAP
jgi:hypothetical protein